MSVPPVSGGWNGADGRIVVAESAASRSCFCGSIGYEYETAVSVADWSIRACQCAFCRAHDALSTSDVTPEASVTTVTVVSALEACSDDSAPRLANSQSSDIFDSWMSSRYLSI